MGKYLFEGKLKIRAGYQVYCKVTGSDFDNQPFVLVIPGGPGFGYRSVEPSVNALLDQARKHKKKPFHYIIFDPIHCGKSDRVGQDEFVKTFTVANYAEMAAQLVEALQCQLNLKTIELHIMGGSFGGLWPFIPLGVNSTGMFTSMFQSHEEA